MAKNGKDTKHTSHISRIVHFVRNGEKFKMNKIYWCEGGLNLADIATNNVRENELNSRMKYIMVVARNNIFDLNWICYGPKRDIWTI